MELKQHNYQGVELEIEREKFLKLMPLPQELLKKFDRYAELLTDWNTKFNLVSKASLPHLWTRHLLDSAQLMPLIPKGTKSLVDLGAGAGFPGIVMSIMGVPKVHLIESIGKKAEFLKIIVAQLKLDAVVHHERIEKIKNLEADVVTARALAPLNELMKFANYHLKKDSICLFLKGKNLDPELTESQKYWRFELERHESLSDPTGIVLVVKELEWKNKIRGRHARKF